MHNEERRPDGPPSLHNELKEPLNPGPTIQGQPSEPQQFDLSDPNHRNQLVNLLIQQKNTGTITKIEVNITD